MSFHAYNCPRRERPDRDCVGCGNNPFFHVRFVEDDVEQEQICVGVPDGQGNYDIQGLHATALIRVTEHRFPFCEVCDVGPNMELLPRKPLFETESTPGTPVDDMRERLFDSNVAKELRSKGIRAEVEAMDWPEVIGE